MNKRNLFSVLSLVMFVLGLLVVPATAQDQNIVEIAASDENFSILVQAVTAAELVETLSGEGPFTVFAPTNDAFVAALGELGVEATDLIADTELLTSVLTYHVVSGAVLSTDLSDGMEVETVNGATFTVNVGDDGVSITDAVGRTVNVVDTDIEASNGVIHVLDNVLLPAVPGAEDEAEEEEEMADEEMMDEEMMEEPFFGVPEGYEVTENFDGSSTLTSGDDTIIVTTPESYAAVISTQEFESDEEELRFFLERTGYSTGVTQDALPSGATTGVGVAISRRDQQGVAYLYDLGRERFAVISLHTGRGQIGAPVADVEAVVANFEFLGTIVDIAVENSAGGNEDRAGLSLLVAAVQAAGLDEALSGEGPFTVFAPTNQAFLNLFAFLQSNYGISQSALLSAENQGLLTQVLLYHVVEGDVFAEDVLAVNDGGNVATLLEDPQDGIVINFRADGTPFLNGTVDLVATDILASNGVVHLIDDVLLPQCVIDTLEGVGECAALAAPADDAGTESTDG
ncbi:MAG: fasciclin domain-containing protein [Chloroflexota bacterium]